MTETERGLTSTPARPAPTRPRRSTGCAAPSGSLNARWYRALLASVGTMDYRTVLSSHHRMLYRQIDGNTYVDAVAGQTQGFQTLLLRRLFQRQCTAEVRSLL